MMENLEQFKARFNEEQKFLGRLENCDFPEASSSCDMCGCEITERTFYNDGEIFCINCACDLAKIPRSDIPESLREIE